MPTVLSGSGSADFHTALPVAEGGTGATASTGSGNVVLSTSPTLTGTIGAAALTLTTPLPITSGGMGIGTGQRIIQVVTGTTSSAVVSSSSTYADTGITATITPKFASSNILVITTIAGLFKSQDASDNRIGLKLIRDTTTINLMLGVLWTQGTAIFLRSSYAHQDLDSPNTTSAVTYKWQFSNEQNAASAAVQRDSNSGNSVITLMEISS